MRSMNVSSGVTNGDARLWTLYSILLDYYIELLLKKQKRKRGPLCKKRKEMNADRTVTSPFHHKTKQHQTPLI